MVPKENGIHHDVNLHNFLLVLCSSATGCENGNLTLDRGPIPRGDDDAVSVIHILFIDLSRYATKCIRTAKINALLKFDSIAVRRIV